MYEADKVDIASLGNPTLAASDVGNSTVSANNVQNPIESAISPSGPNPNPSTPASPPQIVTIPGWTYRGCWTDSTIHRTLIGKKWRGSLTIRRCAIVCIGYRYFGVEYGSE